MEHERENVRKCLAAGYPRLAVILAKSRATQGRYGAALLDGLSADERARVLLLTPEEVPVFIASLAPPPVPTETIEKGYRVKVSYDQTTPEEARARREAVAKVIAAALRNGLA